MTVKTLRKNLVKRIAKLSKKELGKLNGYIDSFQDTGDKEATKELLEFRVFSKDCVKPKMHINGVSLFAGKI